MTEPVFDLYKIRQCKSMDIFKRRRCQGVPKHEGPHWCYKGDGTLMQWRNKKDKDKYWKNISARWIKATDREWIHPKDMNKFYFMTIWADNCRR